MEFKNEKDYDNISLLDDIQINNIQEVLEVGEVLISNLTKKEHYIVKLDLTIKEKEVIKAGGRLNYVKMNN